jgi:death-on-curing protein
LSDPEYLTLEDTFGLIGVLKVGPIRDVGLLDSALARPRSSAFGQDAYATLDLKASALLHSLVKNHPLVDGNKRLAWLSTTVFLLLNGHEANLRNDEAFALVLEVASGSLELEEIAHRFRVQTIGPQDDS